MLSLSEVSDLKPSCFVMMPISDQSGYDIGHFTSVYDDIIRPACLDAGFTPFRADETRQCNLIQEDILRQLLDAPMAVCDLSSQNSNVLFELGIRQAFNLPVVIIKDAKTESIFDVSVLRYYQYDENMSYRSVLRDTEELATCIKATLESYQSGIGIQSIIGLVDVSKRASLMKDEDEISDQKMLELIYEEVRSLKRGAGDGENEIREKDILLGRGDRVIPNPVQAMFSYNPYAAAYAAKTDLAITLQLILERNDVSYNSTSKEELLDLVVEKGILDPSWKKTSAVYLKKFTQRNQKTVTNIFTVQFYKESTCSTE